MTRATGGAAGTDEPDPPARAGTRAGSGEVAPAGIDARLAAAGLPPLPRTAWLEIDLDAIRANLAVIRELAGPGVPVHPVVKADAYGHGAVAVAQALLDAGADGLCVATYDEAVALRRAHVTAPILVLYPIPIGLVADAARRRIAISAGDPDLLAGTLAAMAAVRPRRGLEIQLEVETGLGRGGFASSDVAAAARLIGEAPGVRLVGLWTHLQAPESPSSAAAQARVFEDACAALRVEGLAVPRRHLRASGSLTAGAEALHHLASFEGLASYEGVRPGLSVYGLVPDELARTAIAPAARRLVPALSLRARPVRVMDLPAGWGISYGPSFRTSRPSRIATLPIGYGDGWSRSLSNRAEALVRGGRVPLVGNVAMDAIMADVTGVPGPPVTVADEFVLIGRQGDERITVADLARSRGTNSWEVVTNLARRMPRVYDAASGALAVRTLVSGGDG